MEQRKLLITPKTKVGELLDAYPALENVLLKMSPAFEKLRNPILRKTVARVATLAQVAVVGGIKVEEIVNRLRKEAGQGSYETETGGSDYQTDVIPEWFDRLAVVEIFDATPVINSGDSPMSTIFSKANKLKYGQILEIHTPFVPAPIIDKLAEKKFRVFCINEEGIFKTMITVVS